VASSIFVSELENAAPDPGAGVAAALVDDERAETAWLAMASIGMMGGPQSRQI